MRSRRPVLTLDLTLVYTLWAIKLFDPLFWVASFGPDFVLELPLALFFLLFARALLSGSDRGWFLPLLIFLGALMVTVPFATNKGYAWEGTRGVLLWYFFAIGTIQFVRTPRQAMPIVLMLVFQYVWWALHSGALGRVPWHSSYANLDGYGPLMVIGVGICYFFATATQSRRLRLLAYGLTAFCLLGVVASFARGAVISLFAVLGVMWLRAPRKGPMTAALLLGGVVVLASAEVLFPGGAFWAEMQSAFTEGADSGTGSDRWELWKAAYRVFKESPVFGVGAKNFGVVAVEIIQVGEIGGRYAANPLTLYQRSIHSIYFELLCETGIVGSTAYVVMLVDFWRRNKALRTPHFLRSWEAHDPTLPDLVGISYAVEIAMVAYLCTGFFYHQLFEHWFFTTITLNATLYHVSKPKATAALRQQNTARVVSAQPADWQLASPTTEG